MNSKEEKLRAALEARFSPSQLLIEDESWKHANHAGAKEQGGGHFSIIITSKQFDGKSRIARHRLVHHCLLPLFGPTIHALSIRALASDETL